MSARSTRRISVLKDAFEGAFEGQEEPEVKEGEEGCGGAFRENLLDYSEAATIHGVAYVFSREAMKPAVRCLWAAFVLAMVCLTVTASVNALIDWRSEQVAYQPYSN